MGDDAEYPPAYFLERPESKVEAEKLKKLGVLAVRKAKKKRKTEEEKRRRVVFVLFSKKGKKKKKVEDRREELGGRGQAGKDSCGARIQEPRLCREQEHSEFARKAGHFQDGASAL